MNSRCDRGEYNGDAKKPERWANTLGQAPVETCEDRPVQDQATTKRCPACGQDKPLSAFRRQRKSRDGYQRLCADCAQRRTEDRRAQLDARDPTLKVCPRCGEGKPLSEFWRSKARTDGLQTYCKPCLVRGTADDRA